MFVFQWSGSFRGAFLLHSILCNPLSATLFLQIFSCILFLPLAAIIDVQLCSCNPPLVILFLKPSWSSCPAFLLLECSPCNPLLATLFLQSSSCNPHSAILVLQSCSCISLSAFFFLALSVVPFCVSVGYLCPLLFSRSEPFLRLPRSAFPSGLTTLGRYAWAGTAGSTLAGSATGAVPCGKPGC